MKNNIIYGILIGLFFSHITLAQNDRENLQLNANVKSLKTIDYRVVEHFGEVKKTDIIQGVNLLFNESGLITIQKNYGANGTPIDQSSSVYDENNSIVEQNISDKTGKLIGRMTFDYNDFFKRTYKSVYKFDGSLSSRSAYSYKNKTQLKEIVTYDSHGKKKDLQEFDYHKRKMTKEVTTINPKSNLTSNFKKYDKNENLIESINYDVLGDVKTNITFEYDEKGNMIESKYFEKDKLATKRNLIYNNIGFLVEEKVTYPLIEKIDIINYSYNFDDKVNWVQMIEYMNSVPIRMKERTISYF